MPVGCRLFPAATVQLRLESGGVTVVPPLVCKRSNRIETGVSCFCLADHVRWKAPTISPIWFHATFRSRWSVNSYFSFFYSSLTGECIISRIITANGTANKLHIQWFSPILRPSRCLSNYIMLVIMLICRFSGKKLLLFT